MRLKEIQKKSHEKRAETAKILKIHKQTYDNYVDGRNQPDIETLIKIANHFKISVDYLVGNQTKNIIELHQLSETKKEVIQKIINNNERIALRINAYIDVLTDREIEKETKILKRLDEEETDD